MCSSDLWIARLDALDRSLEEFVRRHFFAPNQIGQSQRIVLLVLGESAHRVFLCKEGTLANWSDQSGLWVCNSPIALRGQALFVCVYAESHINVSPNRAPSFGAALLERFVCALTMAR